MYGVIDTTDAWHYHYVTSKTKRRIPYFCNATLRNITSGIICRKRTIRNTYLILEHNKFPSSNSRFVQDGFPLSKGNSSLRFAMIDSNEYKVVIANRSSVAWKENRLTFFFQRTPKIQSALEKNIRIHSSMIKCNAEDS